MTGNPRSAPPAGTRGRASLAPVAVLLVAQAALLGWSATRHSPSIDEVGHLAAGLHHWHSGTFDLYRVNPPLVRLAATAPLAAAGVELPRASVDIVPSARPEFDLGRRFVDMHGGRAFWYFTAARWACVPFALLVTGFVYAWAGALYGTGAARLSAALWVVCPNALAHGQMITPDTGGAAFTLAACFLYWRWLRRPDWAAAAAAGAALGLALLCKTTSVLLGPVWVATWFAYRFRNGTPVPATRGRQALHLAGAFLVALYLLNAGYGFEGFGERLGGFRFVSAALAAEGPPGVRGNRFAGTVLEDVRVPLPRNFVQGIDVQKRDFESGMRSYLRGEWRTQGWWYYYLYGLLVKTPLGTMAVFGMAGLSCVLAGGARPGWRDELALLLPGVTVLGFVSSQTGFNHHLRYVLPALPFLFVWAGRAAGYSGPLRRAWRSLLGGAAAAAAVSSLAAYPHSLSYFNEAAGGPARGGEHLVDSNVDWGQDLLHLKRWLDDHPEARPLGLAYFGFVDPRAAGIEFSIPPKGPVAPADRIAPRAAGLGPRPGWYAVSVTMLRGYHYPIADGAGGLTYIDDDYFAYFLRCRPVATAGYSIFIYYLDEAECDGVRAELGLPALGAEG